MVRDLGAFARFTEAVSFSHANVLNIANVARECAGDLSGLRAFSEDYPNAKSLLLYRGAERLRIENVSCLPVEDFLRNLEPERPIPSLQ